MMKHRQASLSVLDCVTTTDIQSEAEVEQQQDGQVDSFLAVVERSENLVLQLPDESLSQSVTVRHLSEIYLGAASFALVSDMPTCWLNFELGYDCWAHIATVHESAQSDEIIGLVVTAYGPWTGTGFGKEFIKYVDTLAVGDPLPANFMLDGISRAMAPLNGFVTSQGRAIATDVKFAANSGIRFVPSGVFEFADIEGSGEKSIDIQMVGEISAFNLLIGSEQEYEENWGKNLQNLNSEIFGEIIDGWNEFPFFIVRSDFINRFGLRR